MGRTKDSGLTEAVEFTIDSGQEAKIAGISSPAAWHLRLAMSGNRGDNLMAFRCAVVKRAVAPFVVLVLAGNLTLDARPPQQPPISPAETARVRDRVKSLPAGTRVKVMLFDYKTLGGTLQSVDDDGFTVMTLKKAPGQRRFRFEEVRSVKRPSKIPVGAWVAIIGGGAFLVFAIWFHQVDKNT